ncbi:MAG TPA: methionine aminotransferase [Burkholderiaceae bacterium]|nr:methionine aminotransferase [Burkholderiaceae bacterium]
MTPTDPDVLFGPSKLPGVGTTIFTVMSQLAQEHGAVNLGQGFPDFDCGQQLQEFVAEAMAHGENQYAPMAGLPQLRQAVAAKVQRLQRYRYDAEREITITAGATQAIFTAILALVRPGDEVIILEPAYDSYVPSVLLAGAQPVLVALDHNNSYRVDWDRVQAAITPRTRLLIVNSPHNPTGSIFSEQDILALEHIVRRHGLFLLADEVYEHIVFDARSHLSVASSPELAARAFVVSSFGKTFHCTGWKIGYCCAPAPLSAEFRKVHQFNVFAVNHPMQSAIARYLQDPKPYLELASFYQAKRDHFVTGLSTTRFRAQPCAGTYFVLADYRAISNESETQFARRLLLEHKVASIPVSAFYQQPFDNHVVRFCFGKRIQTLDAGLERLSRV